MHTLPTAITKLAHLEEVHETPGQAEIHEGIVSGKQDKVVLKRVPYRRESVRLGVAILLRGHQQTQNHPVQLFP